jgi:hypothetical protein
MLPAGNRIWQVIYPDYFSMPKFYSRVPATCGINSKKTATWKGAKETWKHTPLCPIRSGPQARNFRRKQRYKVFETCIFSQCLIINKISEKFVWSNEGIFIQKWASYNSPRLMYWPILYNQQQFKV